MINRRDLLIGSACLAAAGAAEAIRPRDRMSLLGRAKLEAAIPKAFDGWAYREAQGLVTPESEDSLAAKLYSQTVGRLYEDRAGNVVMLLIAYGDTQSDTLQLHRPEVCYPAFGFEVNDTRETVVDLGPGVRIPARDLTASSPNRDERISYWTRIGEYLPTSNAQQREMKLRTALAGIIPDGVLFRVSNVSPEQEAFKLNHRFAADLLKAVPAAVRPALITTAQAARLGPARSAA